MDNLRALMLLSAHVCLDLVCASVPFFPLALGSERTGQGLEGCGHFFLVFPPGSIKGSVSIFPCRVRGSVVLF